jgi:hypothetical protein
LIDKLSTVVGLASKIHVLATKQLKLYKEHAVTVQKRYEKKMTKQNKKKKDIYAGCQKLTMSCCFDSFFFFL